MPVALTLLAVVAVVVGVSALARRYGASAPLVLTAVGILMSFVPAIPEVTVGPELILLGILPPLLYATAIRTSLIDLGANKNVIGLLSVGLVVFTAAGVGLVTWWLIGIPFSAAIALGAVVAPPDAVAATAVARRIGLPRRVVTILEGESLFNDATAITILRTSIVAIGGSVTAFDVGIEFAREAIGGVLVGLAVAWVLAQVRKRVTDTTTDTALSFMAPWLAYLPAEGIHASGVLAVVITGVLLGHKAPVIQTAQSRLAERINWTTIQYLLENAVFLVIGLQAHLIISDVSQSALGLPRSILAAAAVLLTVVVLRPIWIAAFGVVLRLTPRLTRPEAFGRNGAVLSWAGMRGVVTLAAVQLLPAETPLRTVLVFVALTVVAATLLIQGLTLPALARRLDVRAPDPREDALQQASVLERATAKGNAELDRLSDVDTPPQIVDQLRAVGQRRTHLAWERLGETRDDQPSPNEAYRRLRRKMLEKEREEVLRIRDTGTVDHEVLEEVMSTLDLEESMLTIADNRNERFNERLITTPDAQRGDCEHLKDAPHKARPQTPEGCVDCLREGLVWVNLRLCLLCGNVGCCDSSIGNHATKHYQGSEHPVMRSFEPGEAWRWCYVDELLG
ncbi:MAG: Na+/H+ antiporter [Actinomycetota bacterium]|nr:Na+/H+ antiporter [Actinomycetota bacterium]